MKGAKKGRGATYPPYIMPHSLIPSQQTDTVAVHLLVVVEVKVASVVVFFVVVFLVAVGLGGFLVVVGFLVIVVVDGHGGGFGLAEISQTS